MSDTSASLRTDQTSGMGRRILAMAWPNILFTLLDSMMRVVDQGLVSRVGEDAMAGIGLSQLIFFIVAIVAMAVPAGVTPVIGQAWGAGDMRRVARLGRQCVLLVAGIGLVMGVVLYTVAPYGLALFAPAKEVVPHGLDYMRTLSFGLAFMFVNFTQVSMFRGIGHVRTPLVLAVVANVINFVLTWALIGGVGDVIPAMGVKGAAIGTIAGRVASAAIGMIIWLRRMRAAGAPDLGPVRLDLEVLTPAVPIALSVMGMHLSRVFAQQLFMGFISHGAQTETLAAAVLVYQIRLVFIMQSMAIQAALMTLVTHALGAGDFESARRYTWRTVAAGSGLIAFFSAIIYVEAGPIVNVVMMMGKQPSPEMMGDAVIMLRWVMVAQVFSTAAIILGGTLVGGGDAKITFVFTLISEWLCMIPVAAWIYYSSTIRLPHIWSAFLASSVAILVLMVWRYRQGRWRRQL